MYIASPVDVVAGNEVVSNWKTTCCCIEWPWVFAEWMEENVVDISDYLEEK
jgi:hypothetical protein